MGNTQQGQRRDRYEASSRRGTAYSDEDQRPFELKVRRPESSPSASTHSMQYLDTSEYPVVLKWNTPAKAVMVSGSWDGWKKKIPMVKSKEDFTTIVNLPEGRHEFKFLVDNSWACDNHLQKTTNQVGTENNVIEVHRDDFDVGDALDRDLQESIVEQAQKMAKAAGKDQITTDHDIAAALTTGEFGQEMPSKKSLEGGHGHRPPTLPPHLLQVVLNKDTPISCDPNVLPEPNHVMLNHLYALSIKDGIMVLSATHRYRKKYVTTLLYKPIG